MRTTLSFLLFLSLVMGLPAQAVDLSELEPRDLDPELLDVSDASFYFDGPVQVYVENLKYGNGKYAAVIDYDGGSGVEIYAPDTYGAGMRPRSIDLSSVELVLNPNGTVTVTNAVLNGSRYAATLQYTSGRMLETTGQIQRLGPGPQQRTIARLESQISNVRNDLEARNKRIEELQSGNAPVAELQNRLDQRNSRIDSLRTRLTALENRIQQLENPAIPTLPKTLQSGFGGQSNSFGQWARPGNTLEQSDSAARFAKTVYPVRQSGSEFTFSVSASAPDSGWVGYGIHFLATGAETAQGYGYGDSYLLWVTRDPKNQTNRGFVQLYRSYNDVHMVQVASAILPISSFDELETTAYVNTAEKEVRVFLEGNYAFSFPAENLKNRAPEVAIRALGPITFTDLTVRGR